MSSNPLQKYFRQPKIFVSLPSKGMFYKEGTLKGDYNNVPIFAMTGMDEIIMKTPDALFNGEATVKLIESCCPYIQDAKNIPSLDIDVLLIAIRLATYGEEMSISHTCKKCKSENNYGVKLSTLLEQYQEKSFDSKISIGEMIVSLKPMTYEEMSKFNVENFKLQKTLSQLKDVEDENVRQQYLDTIYQKLAEIQVEVFLTSIESIQTPDAVVTEKDFIREWLTNTVKDSYQMIKNKLEENKNSWQIPKLSVKCDECGHDDQVELVMDQSNFFV